MILFLCDVCEYIGKCLYSEFSNIFVIVVKKSLAVGLYEFCEFMCNLIEISLHKNTDSVE